MSNKEIYINQQFNNYDDMVQSALNWDFNCNYQLLQTGLKGEHSIISLSKMQLSYSYREGGMMYDIKAPKDTISIAVVDECEDRALYDRVKLKKGYILFFDDSRAVRFMSYGSIKVSIVSIKLDNLGSISNSIFDYLGYHIIDNNFILSTTLQSILFDFKNNRVVNSDIESDIFTIIETLISTQLPQKHKLKSGEILTLNIIDDMINHMDGKIDIGVIAKRYGITTQTLQNNFKSLFGFSAKKFLLLLKLNHAHNNLYHATPQDSTVLSIAIKWGFSHMGNFARYYKELFGVSPSVTLYANYSKLDMMSDECALRQEEI